jgi:LPXTG-motif cell wall-anchored protein
VDAPAPTLNSSALAYTGEPVGQTVGLAAGLSLLGGLCLFAARKRQRS